MAELKHEDNKEQTTNYLRTRFDVTIIKYQSTDDIENESSNNGEEKIFFVSLKPLSSTNKNQSYEKTFNKEECIQIRKESKLESFPLNGFIGEMLYCLSEENKSHSISDKTFENYLNINIDYNIKLNFNSMTYNIELNIPQTNVKEIDILKPKENSMKYTAPILFYETLKNDRNRASGWNIIHLDFCNDINNKFIKHNKDDGSIHVLPGKYIIEAEGTAHCVERHIIQIINDKVTLRLNGTPQMSNQSTNTSRIIRQVIHIEEETNLIFRWWFQETRTNGGLYDKYWPKNDLGAAHVAAVSIQKS
eukprot:51547_1